jgi:hypothetical protein
MRNNIPRLLLLALVGSLAACGSTPTKQDSGMPTAHFDPGKDPYWEDPRWDKNLLDAVQAAVHDPVDPSDMSTPDLHATVKFTYLQGTLEYPEIVTSTGNPDMDKLMLHQLAIVQGPPASGLHADEPHEFVLDLDMPTAYESLEYGVFDALDYAKIYPKEAIITGAQGITAVDFDYADGKLTDVRMIKSSESKTLDTASVGTVTRAIMPAAPMIYAGKTLHMEVMFCYALYQSDKDKKRCPEGRNVILVTGTRIRRVDITRM